MKKDLQLYRPLFLISIVILLTNDLFLKYEYHNFLTGKLSDFAGLFAFPFFISYFYPKQSKPIYIFTGILFMLWKSELSQPIFEAAQVLNIGIYRTIDYSDFIAIIIMPLSYKYFKNDYKNSLKSISILKPLIIGICCFSFIATTLPKEVGKYNMASNLELDIFEENIETVKTKLQLYKLEEDSRFNYSFPLPDKRARISTLVSIEKEENILVIKLDSILNYVIEGRFIFASSIKKDDIDYMRNLEQTEIEKLFSNEIKEHFNLRK